MGNLALKSCGTVGTIPCKTRVLLPDGQLVTFDGPVAVIDMMQRYPNHMVVQCSSDPLDIGETPSMKIMLPDQQLSTGEAYVIYPVPPQYKTILLVAQSYWASKQTASAFGVDHGDPGKIKSEEAEEDTKSCKIRSLRVVASLLPTRMAPCKPGETVQQNETLLKSDWNAGDAHSQEDESEEAKARLYNGWKPALESIPESTLPEIPDSPLYFSTRPMEVL